MPHAGFTAIHSGTIRFGADGRWYCDDEPITNQAICRLYARAMTVAPDGAARLEFGEDRAVVQVDDTPWVVRRVDGDPTTGFVVTLNDETTEPLALGTLRVGHGNVLYCRAKNGTELRLLRPAYYQLMAHAEPTADDGVALRGGDVRVVLGPPE